MTPEQYKVRQELKAMALPDGDSTPLSKRAWVELVVNDVIAEGHCRRSEHGCAICDISGITCETVNEIVAVFTPPIAVTIE